MSDSESEGNQLVALNNRLKGKKGSEEKQKQVQSLSKLLENKCRSIDDIHSLARHDLFRTEVSNDLEQFEAQPDSNIEEIMRTFDTIGPALTSALMGTRAANSDAAPKVQKMVNMYHDYLYQVKIGSVVFVNTSVAITRAHKDAAEWLNEGRDYIKDALDELRRSEKLARRVVDFCVKMKDGAQALSELAGTALEETLKSETLSKKEKNVLIETRNEAKATQAGVEAILEEQKKNSQEKKDELQKCRDGMKSKEAKITSLLQEDKSFLNRFEKMGKSALKTATGGLLDLGDEDTSAEEKALLKEQIKKEDERAEKMENQRAIIQQKVAEEAGKQAKLAKQLKNMKISTTDLDGCIKFLTLAYKQLNGVKVAMTRVMAFYAQMQEKLTDAINVLQQLTNESEDSPGALKKLTTKINEGRSNNVIDFMYFKVCETLITSAINWIVLAQISQKAYDGIGMTAAKMDLLITDQPDDVNELTAFAKRMLSDVADQLTIQAKKK